MQLLQLDWFCGCFSEETTAPCPPGAQVNERWTWYFALRFPMLPLLLDLWLL